LNECRPEFCPSCCLGVFSGHMTTGVCVALECVFSE
jgi:hypothetical protein